MVIRIPLVNYLFKWNNLIFKWMDIIELYYNIESELKIIYLEIIIIILRRYLLNYSINIIKLNLFLI